MIKILVSTPGREPAQFEVPGDQAVIGRAADCDVRIDQPYVSKRHLQVFHGIVVVDLGSANGSFIRGERLRAKEAVLVDGAGVVLGVEEIELRFETSRGATSNSAPNSPIELDSLRAKHAALEAENAKLRAALAERQLELDRARKQNEELARRLASADSDERTTVEPIEQRAASSAGPVPIGGARALLREIAEKDVDVLKPRRDSDAEEFVLLEAIRFLRKVERVVTYQARDFVQLVDLNTMLPEHDRNFRAILGVILSDPKLDESRRELASYLEVLGTWLIACQGAYREAAKQLALELKYDLSESALTQKNPISGLKRIEALRDAELWKRAADYVKDLTSDALEERIEKLARAAATKLAARSPSS